MPYVYILKCADDSYYVGRTVDIERRLAQHQDGTFGGYTAARRPVELKWHQLFQTEDEAFKMERRLKDWSRAKKEAVIAGEFERLHEIATEYRHRQDARKKAKR